MIKRPVLGQTRRNINEFFRTQGPPGNCRLKTTSFGTLVLLRNSYVGDDACTINSGVAANDMEFGEQGKPALGHLCLHGYGYHLGTVQSLFYNMAGAKHNGATTFFLS